MPARDAVPFGAPCWIELFTSDPDRAEQFYGELFGWTAEHSGPEYGGYVNFRHGDALIAGMMRNDGSAGAPDVWSTYLAVADAKATAEAAVAAGGQVLVEPMQVGTLGVMGLLADPGGAAIGMWQPGTHRGYGLFGEAGAPVWHELHTRDYAATLDFYRAAFGWQTSVMSDTDDFRYTTAEIDGQSVRRRAWTRTTSFPRACRPAGRSTSAVPTWTRPWPPSSGTAARSRQPAEDTPYGRLAQIADPTGATIKLSSSA